MSYQEPQPQQQEDPALIPCDHVLHPLCIVDGNPEHWPVLGGIVTKLTDLVGDIAGRPVTNGYYGFALLIAIIVGIIILSWVFGKKQILAFTNKIRKKL